MPILISGLQNRVKNSAAYAEELGLMLISNGEELPYLLTATGQVYPAGITAPIVAPTIADDGTGNLEDGKFAVYAFVYVAENAFPLIGARIFSNPSPLSATFEINTSGVNRQNEVTVTESDDPIVTHVWIFRTSLQTTALLAETAAAAGQMFFLGSVSNGTLTFTDNLLTNGGNDLIEYTNFTVPQFRFAVWDGSYFWGFANHPFRAEATWELDGTITLDNPTDKFWGGRNNQFITLDGITTGGIDGRGTFLFEQTGDYTGKVIYEDGTDAILPSTTSGTIVIIGPSANLYRSAFRNPFAWGYLANIAGTYVPALWEVKISGSLGTAIAIIPDQQLLKLDMEFPALCVTFSLQTSGTDVFQNTRRQVSRLYSVTSHFSQFSAISQGRQVLWGFDAKNLAIIQSDGYTQVPVSGPISILLRELSRNRSLHLLTHGIYDPVTEINAIWLSSSAVDEANSPMLFDICVYQHVPTGFWGVFQDHGILCSAAIEDAATSQRSILVGSESGFVGKAFDSTTYGNWLPSNSIHQGYINYATADSIRRSEGQDDFNPTDAGLIGNFCLIVNSQGLNPQIRKISAVTFDTLTFETDLTTIPLTTEETGILEDTQFQFFIGLIEIRMLKYFDEGTPTTDKTPREYWATMSDAEAPRLEFHSEHTETSELSVALKQDADLDAWFTKTQLPTKKGKTYGLSLVERSYQPTRFYNFTVK
jgi:hypothetical protein